MRILADLNVTKDDWPRLKELLRDNDPEISISAARVALDSAIPEDKCAAIETLIGRITYANWCVQAEIENSLVKHYGVAQREIADQIAQRSMQPEKIQASDPVLQMLRSVRKRVGGSGENAD